MRCRAEHIFIALALLAGACTSKRHVSRGRYEPLEKIETPPARVIPGKTRQRILSEAKKWLGTPYRYGGESRKGTDCSGMVMCVYRDAASIKLPRDSRSQQQFCKPLKRSGLAPGDLVFFATKVGGSKVGHVGIYISDGDFIHASSSRGVIISNLEQDYYKRHYHSAGRVPSMDSPVAVDNGAAFDELYGPRRKSPAKPIKELESKPVVMPEPAEEISLEELLAKPVEMQSDSVASVHPPSTRAPEAANKKEEADSIRASVKRAMRF
ncbi:MAG: C40 family peptidase [Muribaculaceae bacterium]|nr:C40 family peptidase [Muribaculaceae bacterium]